MPIYEFECESCGVLHIVHKKIEEPDPAECRLCGGRLKKIISAPNFILKGAGWGRNGYARKMTDDDA